MSTHIEGRLLTRSVTEFERLCLEKIDREERKMSVDREVVTLLSDAVRLSREHVDVLARWAFNPRHKDGV